MLAQDVGSCVAALTFAQAAAAFALVSRESKSGAKGVPASKFGTAAKYASTASQPRAVRYSAGTRLWKYQAAGFGMGCVS